MGTTTDRTLPYSGATHDAVAAFERALDGMSSDAEREAAIDAVLERCCRDCGRMLAKHDDGGRESSGCRAQHCRVCCTFMCAPRG